MLVCALYEAGRPIRARQRGVGIKKRVHTFLKCAPLALVHGYTSQSSPGASSAGSASS
jgi:hypothetical protein